MPRRTERRLLAVLGAVAALLVTVMTMALVALERAAEDLQRVSRAHELVARVRSAHLAVADTESGLRGYLLTGDAALVEPASEARLAIRRHVARARELTEEDAEQRARVERLAALVEGRVSTMDAVLAERGAGPLPPPRAAAAIAEGSRQTDGIHDAVGEILETAERRIAARSEVVASAARARGTVLAGIVGSALLLLIGGFLLVRRELALRRAAEASLTAARHAAEDAGKELEAFSYSLAHDLRAPLRAIDGFALALTEDAEKRLEPSERDALRRIRAAAQRMGTLIDDLLDLARITRTRFVRETVDLTELATSVADELRSGDPAREVEVAVAPGLVVEGDRRLLRVALENLLGNAWKYTSKRPRARIELARADGDPSTYVVRDDGAGFDMAYAGRLFGPFQRLHAESEFPGTGIGLATVQRVVHRHGGTVRAEGRVGEGASFFFTLPKVGAVGETPPSA